MFNTLSDMEKAESLTEGFFARALEGPGLKRMKNIIVELKQLGDGESGKYEKDLKGWKNITNQGNGYLLLGSMLVLKYLKVLVQRGKEVLLVK